MIEHQLEKAFCSALQGDNEFHGLHFYTALDDDNHQLPALTIVSKSESLVGSTEFFRVAVELRIEHHAKDHTPEEHAAIVERVRVLLTAKTDVIATINAQGSVQVIGYAVMGAEQEVNDGASVTVVSIKTGCRHC